MLELKIKYFDAQMPRLNKISKGDWIDVRANQLRVNGENRTWLPQADQISKASKTKDNEELSEIICYEAGDDVLIHLGFAMQLPAGYEAHILPRSSTFRKYGLILVNSMGVIDNSYQGENDEWLFACYALRAGLMTRFARVGQFRIVGNMPEVSFFEVSSLRAPDRGGYGSTDQEY